MKRSCRCALAALLLLLPSLAAAQAGRGRITGTATYRERVSLSSDAVFEVLFEDITTTPAEVIVRSREVNPGQVPIAFDLSYDTRRIQAGHSYALRATVREDGRLRFSSEPIRVITTRGRTITATLLMREVSDWSDGDRDRTPDRGRALGSLPATFAGLVPCDDCAGVRYQLTFLSRNAYALSTTYLRDGHDDTYYEWGEWALSRDGRTVTLNAGRRDNARWAVRDRRTLEKVDARGRPVEASEITRRDDAPPIALRGTMRGMFRYEADAARFRECRTGLEWPVATRDGYRLLERAYTSRRSASRSELLVSLKGRIEDLPRAEGSRVEPTLVVEEFLNAMPGQECDESRDREDRDEPEPASGIEGRRWRLADVDDESVDDDASAWIVLDSGSKRVSGSGGCNRVSGTYRIGDGTLRFGPLVSTKMACDDLDVETAFLRALEATRTYRVRGRTLDLFDGAGDRVARLEAQP